MKLLKIIGKLFKMIGWSLLGLFFLLSLLGSLMHWVPMLFDSSFWHHVIFESAMPLSVCWCAAIVGFSYTLVNLVAAFKEKENRERSLVAAVAWLVLPLLAAIVVITLGCWSSIPAWSDFVWFGIVVWLWRALKSFVAVFRRNENRKRSFVAALAWLGLVMLILGLIESEKITASRAEKAAAKEAEKATAKEAEAGVELGLYYLHSVIDDGKYENDDSKYDKAILHFNDAIERNPQSVRAYNGRGEAYCYKSDYEKAIADFTKAVELNPQYSDAYKNRGIAHFANAKKDYDKAWADAKKCQELGGKIEPGFLEDLRKASGRNE